MVDSFNVFLGGWRERTPAGISPADFDAFVIRNHGRLRSRFYTVMEREPPPTVIEVTRLGMNTKLRFVDVDDAAPWAFQRETLGHAWSVDEGGASASVELPGWSSEVLSKIKAALPEVTFVYPRGSPDVWESSTGAARPPMEIDVRKTRTLEDQRRRVGGIAAVRADDLVVGDQVETEAGVAEFSGYGKEQDGKLALQFANSDIRQVAPDDAFVLRHRRYYTPTTFARTLARAARWNGVAVLTTQPRELALHLRGTQPEEKWRVRRLDSLVTVDEFLADLGPVIWWSPDATGFEPYVEALAAEDPQLGRRILVSSGKGWRNFSGADMAKWRAEVDAARAKGGEGYLPPPNLPVFSMDPKWSTARTKDGVATPFSPPPPPLAVPEGMQLVTAWWRTFNAKKERRRELSIDFLAPQEADLYQLLSLAKKAGASVHPDTGVFDLQTEEGAYETTDGEAINLRTAPGRERIIFREYGNDEPQFHFAAAGPSPEVVHVPNSEAIRGRASELLRQGLPPMYEGLLRTALENDAPDLELQVERAEIELAKSRTALAQTSAQDLRKAEQLADTYGRDARKVLAEYRKVRAAQDRLYERRRSIRRDERSARKARLENDLDHNARRMDVLRDAYRLLTGSSIEL